MSFSFYDIPPLLVIIYLLSIHTSLYPDFTTCPGTTTTTHASTTCSKLTDAHG